MFEVVNPMFEVKMTRKYLDLPKKYLYLPDHIVTPVEYWMIIL